MSNTDNADAKPESAPKSRKKNSGWSGVGFLLLVLIAGVIGGGVAAYLGRELQSARLADIESRFESLPAPVAAENLRPDLAALETRIATLEGRLGTVETAVRTPPPQMPAADPRVPQLMARLDALEGALPADLAARLNAAPSRVEMNALVTRLTMLENSNSGEMLRRAASALALSEVSQAAAGPEPFSLQLNALAAAAPNDPALGVLRRYAAEGVPTRGQLAAEFDDVARAALTADHTIPGEGFITRIWNGLLGLVTIRRIGEVEGDGVNARIARAENALRGDDLRSAVEELRPLEGAAAESVAPWLARAETRLAVDDGVAAIQARAAQTLARQNEATPAP